jgi:hypothetical protein
VLFFNNNKKMCAAADRVVAQHDRVEALVLFQKLLGLGGWICGCGMQGSAEGLRGRSKQNKKCVWRAIGFVAQHDRVEARVLFQRTTRVQFKGSARAVQRPGLGRHDGPSSVPIRAPKFDGLETQPSQQDARLHAQDVST